MLLPRARFRPIFSLLMIISTLRVGPSGPLFLFWAVARALRTCQNVTQDDRCMTPGDAASDARFTGESGVAGEVAQLVEPVLGALGYRLIRVVVGGGAQPTLQIMAERADGTMTVEDCAVLSRELSPLLDAHDPIATRYTLEVSSPGIDRPLVRASDFEAWRGWHARLETKEPIAGRRRFRGILQGMAEGEVRLALE